MKFLPSLSGGLVARLAAMAVMSLLFMAGAWSQKVNVETDGSFDFAKHRSYMWREHPLAKKDASFQDATVAAEIVRSTVNTMLMGKGFHPVDHAPDFYVTYFVTGQITEDLRAISSIGTTYWYGWSPMYYSGWTKYVVEQELQGVLLLDFVDARTNQLAWRAYCRDTIKDMRTRDRNITRAVNKALKKFPP